jgi:hypothetical protein
MLKSYLEKKSRSIYETRLSTAAKKECLKLMLVNNFTEKAFWASFLII